MSKPSIEAESAGTQNPSKVSWGGGPAKGILKSWEMRKWRKMWRVWKRKKRGKTKMKKSTWEQTWKMSKSRKAGLFIYQVREIGQFHNRDKTV